MRGVGQHNDGQEPRRQLMEIWTRVDFPPHKYSFHGSVWELGLNQEQEHFVLTLRKASKEKKLNKYDGQCNLGFRVKKEAFSLFDLLINLTAFINSNKT